MKVEELLSSLEQLIKNFRAEKTLKAREYDDAPYDWDPTMFHVQALTQDSVCGRSWVKVYSTNNYHQARYFYGEENEVVKRIIRCSDHKIVWPE